MRSAIIIASLFLLMAASFAFTGSMKYVVNAPNTTPAANVSINTSDRGHVLIATRNQTMIMNQTESNNSIKATVQKEATTIMNMIKNKENKTYMFQVLHNSTNGTITEIARKNIMIMVQKSVEFKNQLMNNKTMLSELIPEYKNIIQKGTVQNISVKTQNNQTIMQVKIVEQKKLFGFIPVNINEEIITNGTNAKIEQPWWAIFAI